MNIKDSKCLNNSAISPHIAWLTYFHLKNSKTICYSLVCTVHVPYMNYFSNTNNIFNYQNELLTTQ